MQRPILSGYHDQCLLIRIASIDANAFIEHDLNKLRLVAGTRTPDIDRLCASDAHSTQIKITRTGFLHRRRLTIRLIKELSLLLLNLDFFLYFLLLFAA